MLKTDFNNAIGAMHQLGKRPPLFWGSFILSSHLLYAKFDKIIVIDRKIKNYQLIK